MRGGGSLWCRRCSAALRQAVLPIPAEYQPTGAAGTRRAPGFSGIAAVAAVADHHGVAAGSTLAAGGAIPAGATVTAVAVQPGLAAGVVTSDAHAGLVAAIGATLPAAAWQRCRTHYAANHGRHNA